MELALPRTARPARDVATETDLLVVAEPIRRTVLGRLASGNGSAPVEVEDVVQETLTRLWEARWRLERAALLPYGLVVARNMISAAQRQEMRRERYAPRLVDRPETGDPATDVLAEEERAALLQALAALRTEDRRLLVEHEVHGVEAGKIAAERGLAPNTIAARLARARARLRVEHLLALRHVTLPTARCRGVLDAISLGDRSRQRTLLAAEHLLQCATCSQLAEPLLGRRRALTGVAPVAVLLAVPGKLWGWLRVHPLPAAGAGASATAVAVAVAVLVARPDPAPAPPRPAAAAPATLSVGGSRVLPAARVRPMTADVGQTAVARDVPVQSVPADEGFWVGGGPGQRVWVQLRTATESTVRIRPGQRVSFTGTVARTTADMPDRVGLSPAEGAAELHADGAYVLVDAARLTLR
jgi:RNA polymerase sigma factor (sigma-70 family)